MKVILFVIVTIASIFIGIWGFCQIVGTIKYFRRAPLVLSLFTILIWTVILSAIGVAVHFWLPNYKTALYIGYGISFLMSLGTKPD